MIRHALICLLLLACGQVSAQDLRFNSLGQGKGLSSDWVWAFTQDSSGLIWIGTDAGLTRFDGYETKNYKHLEGRAESLSSNKVRALHVDTTGQLWVGSEDGGLDRFNEITQNFESFDFGDRTVNSIYSIANAGDDLLIGTESGLFVLPNNSTTDSSAMRHVSVSRERKVLSLAVDRTGIIWIGTNEGLFRYDHKQSGSLREVTLGDGKPRIFSLSIDANSTLWIAAEREVYAKPTQVATPIQKFSEHLPETYITSVQPLHTGQIAIGTLDGMFIYTPFNDTMLKFERSEQTDSLKDHQIFKLFEDRANVLWIGTFAGGAHYVNPTMLNIGLLREQGECSIKNTVAVLADSQGNNWVARGNEVIRLAANGVCETYSIETAEEQRQAQFLGLYEDLNGTIWASLDQQGLTRFDSAANRFVRVDLSATNNLTISSYFQTQANELWLGTEKNGLIRFFPDTVTAEMISKLGEMSIFDIKPWRERLLLATTEGGLLFDPVTQSVSSPFKLPDGIEVLSILADQRREEVWIGTRSNGLFRALLDGKGYQRISTDQEFYGETVRVLLADMRGTIWVGSSEGIFHLPVGEQRFKRWQKQDGLHGDVQISGVYSARNDRLLFGGSGGINMFSALLNIENSVPPIVAVTKFSRPDGSNSLHPSFNSSVELPYDNKDFKVEFTAAHYEDPRRNRYAYKLENYDKDWLFGDYQQRQATYTNLPAGNFTLRLKASNKDGVWIEHSKNLDIHIKPAPWATWWAKVIFFTLGLIVLYGLIHWRDKNLRNRANDLQLRVAQRTEKIAQQNALIEQMLERKNDLFAAISHEFRTPLTLLSGPLDMLATRLPDGRSDEDLQLIENNSQRLLRLVDQLLSLARLDSDDALPVEPILLAPAIMAVVDSFRLAAQHRNIIIELAPVDPRATVLATPDSLDLVLGNVLSNAIKYSEPNGTITLSISTNDKETAIFVQDNGPGIAPGEHSRIFERFYRVHSTAHIQGTGLGLAVAREHARSCHGDIKVVSSSTTGACMRLTFPTAHVLDDTVLQANSHTTITELTQFNPWPSQAPATMETEFDDRPQVLIIDDDLSMRSFISRCLHQFNCITATNGEDGIELALDTTPDIVVSDVMMPKKDGFDVAYTLRHDPRTSHIPIILLTARVDQTSRMRGWEENVDEYLNKPFQPAELVARINSILAVRSILQRKLGQQVVEGIGHSINLEANPGLPEREAQFLIRLDEQIATHFGDSRFGPEQAANGCAMSVRQLQRKLRAILNMSPADYLRNYRLKQAAQQLCEGYQVGLVSDACGFGSAGQFSRCFKAHFGVPPKQYQSQHKAAHQPAKKKN